LEAITRPNHYKTLLSMQSDLGQMPEISFMAPDDPAASTKSCSKPAADPASSCRRVSRWI